MTGTRRNRSRPPPPSKNTIGNNLGMTSHGRHLAYSPELVPAPAASPTCVQLPCPLWGSRFLSADVGVLGPGEATGPAARIDIATGIRPAARLKRVIADLRLQLAKVIIHHSPSLVPAADDPGPEFLVVRPGTPAPAPAHYSQSASVAGRVCHQDRRIKLLASPRRRSASGRPQVPEQRFLIMDCGNAHSAVPNILMAGSRRIAVAR
jgi:hypothetical protein